MASIDRIGEREMRATTAITARISARWLGALNHIDVERLRSLATDVKSDDGLRTLFAELEDDRSSLMAASAELRQDQIALALQNRRLREFASLLDSVEQMLAKRDALDRDVEHAATQRRKDLLEQAANAANAHSALRRMASANDEVVLALRSAGNAALLALRSAPSQRAPLLAAFDDIEIQRRRALRGST